MKPFYIATNKMTKDLYKQAQRDGYSKSKSEYLRELEEVWKCVENNTK